MSTQIIKAFPERHRIPIPDDPGRVLDVAEFYCDTIQGEGVNTGVPAAFLRLQNCTLNCVYCFGIKPGRRIPRITTLNGSNKKINEVKVGDVLLTFDEKTKKLVETRVKKMISRKVTRWREVKIKDTIYYVTPEHSFFLVNNEVKQAKDLESGNQIYHSSFEQKLSYKVKKNNPMWNEKTVQKMKENTDWKKLGEKISSSIKRKKEEGTYIPSLLIVKEKNPKRFEQFRQNISKRMKGEQNPNWQGGSQNPNYDILKEELKKGLHRCEKCDERKKLEVHHIDHNPDNDNLNNLEKLCHECHSREHKRGYNFWNGKRKDGKVSKTADSVLNGFKVIYNKEVDISNHSYYGKSYGPKELEVFNLSCEPYNTYLVDNMWVHNCDTTEVWRVGNPYSFDELFLFIEKADLIYKFRQGQHLICTGGSPLKQQWNLFSFFEEFVKKYQFLPYLEIENECVLRPLQELTEIVNCWNNSPKLASSKNSKRARHKPSILKYMSELKNSWFKFVIECPEDWQEIQMDFLDPGLINRNQIILMPMGMTKEELFENQKMTAEMAIKHNVRYSSREHIVLWDKKVGI